MTTLSAPTLTDAQTEQIARLIELKANIAALEADAKTIGNDLIDALGEGQYVLDGKGKVVITSATRRSVDVDVAKGRLSRKVFDMVTETKVSMSQWDAAAKLGLLPEDAGDIVTSVVGDSFIKVTVAK